METIKNDAMGLGQATIRHLAESLVSANEADKPAMAKALGNSLREGSKLLKDSIQGGIIASPEVGAKVASWAQGSRDSVSATQQDTKQTLAARAESTKRMGVTAQTSTSMTMKNRL